MYIIKSKKDGSFYIGQCQNLLERLLRHNNGHTSSTKAKKPWELVYYEEVQTRSEAVRREREIKKQKSHKYIESLISKFSKTNIIGAVAQLGERLNGIQEVVGSIPISSTRIENRGELLV